MVPAQVGSGLPGSRCQNGIRNARDLLGAQREKEGGLGSKSLGLWSGARKVSASTRGSRAEVTCWRSSMSHGNRLPLGPTQCPVERKCDFYINSEGDPEGGQLGPSANFAPCNGMSERCIFMAVTQVLI